MFQNNMQELNRDIAELKEQIRSNYRALESVGADWEIEMLIRQELAIDRNRLAALEQQRRSLQATAVAQPRIPLYPPVAPEGSRYILQIIVFGIDGTRAGLTQDGGFRRFVERNCSGFGLSGCVWRVPPVHGKILARGTPDQLDQLLDFVKNLRINGFIQTFAIERNKQDYYITSNAFTVMPSDRPRVLTRKFSGPALYDVSSTDSADIPGVGSPVPFHG